LSLKKYYKKIFQNFIWKGSLHCKYFRNR